MCKNSRKMQHITGLTERPPVSILRGRNFRKEAIFTAAFFLTGAVQTGKSTAISRFLSANPALRRGGFLTVSIPTECGYDVFLVPPVWTERDLVPRALAGRRGRGGGGCPENFDGRGCELLASRECDILLMDELGRMELGAAAFRAAVIEALHGPVPVLGVIKPEHNAFLDEVRAQDGTELFTLTPENRGEAPAAIAAWFARVRGPGEEA